jgi:hypothetical protein
VKVVDATEQPLTELPEFGRLSESQREIYEQLDAVIKKAVADDRFEECAKVMFSFAVGGLRGAGWSPDQLLALLDRGIEAVRKASERKPE